MNTISFSNGLGVDPLKEKLNYLVRAGKCDEAWDFLWSLAKAGASSARIYMSSSIAAGVMVPKYLNAENYAEYITFFSLYAVAANKEAVYDESEDLLRLLPESPLKQSTQLCFDSGMSKSKCVNHAIEMGLMPSFEDFASTIDSLNVRGGVCLRPGR